MWATGSVGLCCFWWCVDWFCLPFYFGIGLTGLRVCGIWGIGEKLTFEAVCVVWNKAANGTEADPLTLLQPYIIIMILHTTPLIGTDRQTIQKQSRSIHNRQQTMAQTTAVTSPLTMECQLPIETDQVHQHIHFTQGLLKYFGRNTITKRAHSF